MKLTTRVHDRDVEGLRYVYPVVSRRAGGVSLGINLNPNNACNWRCLYCQVPNLTAGKGPPIELDVLRDELRRMLYAITRGDYLERNVPEPYRQLNDVALSGNGEPTSSPQFEEAIALAREELATSAAHTKIVLITNGSLVHQPQVQRGLARLAEGPTEVWYKLDAATDEGQARLNDAHIGAEKALANLRLAAGIAPTWIQTMALAMDGEAPSARERAAYLRAVEAAVEENWGVRGVLLYGLARVSHQPEAPRLEALPEAWLEAFAAEIRQRGLPVSVHL